MSRANLKNLKPRNKPKAKPAKSNKPKKNANELSRKSKVMVMLYVWLGVLSPLLIVGLMIVSTFESDLPSIEALENPRSDESTNLYDANGKMIGTFFAMHTNRTKVTYQELPQHLINALKATEDKRFLDHSGVDGRGLMRAVLGAMVGSKKGGASTISQQLAKMMFHEPAKTPYKRIRQKFAEWIIASRLETRYTKDEIIAMYFNEFDFTHNAVGIHSAARIYYGKEPKELTIQECAALVGMAKNPNFYNPKSKPENSQRRREVVLKLMMGEGYITAVEYDSLRALPSGLNFSKETYNTGNAPYLRAYVKNETKAIIKQNGLLNEYGKPFDVERDGLKIYTTLDLSIQKYAEKAVADYVGGSLQGAFTKDVKKNKNYPFGDEVSATTRENVMNRAVEQSERYKALKVAGKSDAEIKKVFAAAVKMEVFDWKSKDYKKEITLSPLDSIKYYKQLLRVGMVSIDPNTGFVKAWVGGPNYEAFKYDNVYQSKRQVGSTIKPFVYASAIESSNASGGFGNMTPCSEFPDVQYCIEIPNGNTTKLWCPGGQKEYGGLPTPLYFALANSMNNVTAKLTENPTVIPRVNAYFEMLKLKNNSFTEGPSLALGVCDLSVMDITSAHTIFSNNGAYIKPIVIARIEDKHGKVIYESHTEVIQVLDENTAFDVLKMMKGVTGVRRPVDGSIGGTARRIRDTNKPYAFTGIMAGKTGTTQNNSDGWFVGHTPDLVTGIWVGCEDPTVHFRETGLGQGANTSLPIWGYFMKAVYKDKGIKINKGDFTAPTPGAKTVIECEEIPTQHTDQDKWYSEE